MTNLLNENMYFLNEDEDRIYRLKSVETFNNGSLNGNIEMELICGRDYPSEEKYPKPEDNESVKWCSAEYFIEEVRSESIHFNMMYDTIDNRLEDEGFDSCSLPSKIYEF